MSKSTKAAAKAPPPRGPGRPPLPEGAARATMFCVRISASDHEAIKAAAKRAGIASVSDWARAALVAASVEVVRGT